MAIEVISWIGCEPQSESTPLEWLGIMKLAAQGPAADESVREAIEQLAAEGGPCAECFAADSPCYRAITFPIDQMGERMLFDYFLRQLREPNSPGDQIYRDSLNGEQSERQWEKRGAGSGSTHEATEPSRETLEGQSGAVVDSSQMFAALFADVNGVEAVTAHGLFWRGFANFVPQVMVPRSRTLAELTALAPLFEFTVKQTVTGAPACDVIFFVNTEEEEEEA